MEIYTEEVETVDTKSEDLDIFDYAKQIIACKIEIKAVQDSIKVIKMEAKENGVLIKEIDTVMNDILKEMKKDPSETMIEDDIRIKLENNEDVMASISMLV